VKSGFNAIQQIMQPETISIAKTPTASSMGKPSRRLIHRLPDFTTLAAGLTRTSEFPLITATFRGLQLRDRCTSGAN
jgi:hypothetical protein